MSAGLSIFLPIFGVRSQETARPKLSIWLRYRHRALNERSWTRHRSGFATITKSVPQHGSPAGRSGSEASMI